MHCSFASLLSVIAVISKTRALPTGIRCRQCKSVPSTHACCEHVPAPFPMSIFLPQNCSETVSMRCSLTMMLQQARQWFNQLFSHRGAWTRVPTQEVPIALGDPLIPPSASPPSQHTAGNHRPGDGPSPRTAAAAAAQARQAKFEASQKKTAGPS
ncbi:TPA: hypothetical protein ACH3X3_013013 [Trebouxia sp. C0006]